MHPTSRRDFLLCASAAASVSLLPGSALALAPPPPFVRQDIASLSATSSVIVSYRKAIKAMRALPTANPLSWTYQAAIHGTTITPTHVAWNTCTHGSPFFWPWHRMYLYWFERIIRKMSGDASWALPYWNWTAATERHLPAVFRDASSELYTSNRNLAMNNGTGSLPSADVSYASAFSFTNMLTASSTLEGTPHGAVHVDVGGWMSSVPTSAQDPIFYLHHSNIDRLWNLYLAQGGGRADPLSNTTWKNTSFTFFDENGAQVHMTACDVLRASEQLQYTYAGEPPQVKEYCLRIIRLPPWILEVVWQFPGPPVELGPQNSRIDIDLSAIRERLTAVARSTSQTLALKLEGVQAERQPGASWEVYLSSGDSAQLNTESPNFLGLVALFGAGVNDEAHHDAQTASFTFPVNVKATAALLSHPKTSLIFVPHGILIDGKPSKPEVKSKVRIGSISLAVGESKGQ